MSYDNNQQIQDTDHPISAMDLKTFLDLELPERRMLLTPWLPHQGLAMIYAPRGIGKTYLALTIAFAVATGTECLGWKAQERAKVLYLDGEMSATDMQKRLIAIKNTVGIEPSDGYFNIITPDLVAKEAPFSMPDLRSVQGQQQIASAVDSADLIIVDNISTLCRSGVENDAESWGPVQQWALLQRARGKTVLFIHHAGKGGQQRGTSKKEDVLDTVVALRTPAGHSADQGAAFELHFEKARGFHGTDAEPMEVRLMANSHKTDWTFKSIGKGRKETIQAMYQDGMTQTKIAEALDVHKSTVSRSLGRGNIRKQKT